MIREISPICFAPSCRGSRGWTGLNNACPDHSFNGSTMRTFDIGYLMKCHTFPNLYPIAYQAKTPAQLLAKKQIKSSPSSKTLPSPRVREQQKSISQIGRFRGSKLWDCALCRHDEQTPSDLLWERKEV